LAAETLAGAAGAGSRRPAFRHAARRTAAAGRTVRGRGGAAPPGCARRTRGARDPLYAAGGGGGVCHHDRRVVEHSPGVLGLCDPVSGPLAGDARLLSAGAAGLVRPGLPLPAARALAAAPPVGAAFQGRAYAAAAGPGRDTDARDPRGHGPATARTDPCQA